MSNGCIVRRRAFWNLSGWNFNPHQNKGSRRARLSRDFRIDFKIVLVFWISQSSCFPESHHVQEHDQPTGHFWSLVKILGWLKFCLPLIMRYNCLCMYNIIAFPVIPFWRNRTKARVTECSCALFRHESLVTWKILSSVRSVLSQPTLKIYFYLI